MVRSGQPRADALSWKRAELGPGGLARVVRPKSTTTVLLEATSATTDQVALEALGLLQPVGHPKMSRAETAFRFGQTCKRCLSKPAGPEAGRFYSRGHTQARGSMCVFNAPEGAPHRISPMASGSCRDARAEQARLSRPQQSWGRRPPRRPGLPLSPERQARPGAGDPQAGQLRPRDWTCRSGSQLLTEVSGAHRSGRGTTRSVNCRVG